MLWIDASSGVSGDMLLGAFVDAGVPLDVPQAAVDRLGLEETVSLVQEPVTRSGLRATWVRPVVPESDRPRRLADVVALLERLDEPVRATATAAFHAPGRGRGGRARDHA
ncbi:nickel insertion protein [Nocardioides sp. TF02-7]|uniref:nickel insertion protein n=1 Tax=Nocardioides sp. TF02-7 TaxID=2917724 RepID=UPI0023D9BEEC|nr:nickel insertion protein [Nocardioides sp. TF02-7]